MDDSANGNKRNRIETVTNSSTAINATMDGVYNVVKHEIRTLNLKIGK